MPKKRILIVEDERHIAEAIRLNLENEGFDAEVEAHGNYADELVQNESFDLIVLDIMLPGYSGFEICQRMRQRDDRTPVLFLTARKAPMDRIRGLDIGGDDYLVKPFHIRELISRVQAILRRRAWISEDLESDVIEVGDNQIDLRAMEIKNPRNTYSLSRRECLILKLLIEQAGKPVSRNDILDRAWGQNQYPTDRTVDNFIVRLRQNIEPDPVNPRHICTVRGVGYKLVIG